MAATLAYYQHIIELDIARAHHKAWNMHFETYRKHSSKKVPFHWLRETKILISN